MCGPFVSPNKLFGAQSPTNFVDRHRITKGQNLTHSPFGEVVRACPVRVLFFLRKLFRLAPAG